MINIKNLYLKKGNKTILKNINLIIKKGSYFVILGPTGSGKTLLAESIAGIEKFTGNIIFNEDAKPAIVYQNFALLPHLNVKQNISLPLRITKEKTAIIDYKVAKISKELNIHDLLEKKIHTLSGGEKQKTAIARALVSNANLLILDEPLSAIDPPFRKKMYKIFKDIQKNYSLTILHITHNFEEAMYLSDEIAILNNGQIEDCGDINRIFKYPKSIFSASFVGADNIIPIETKNNKRYLKNIDIELSYSYKGKKYVVLHAEDIILSEKKIVSSAKFCLKGKITKITKNKYFSEVKVDIGNTINTKITNTSLEKMNLKENKTIYITFKESSLVAI